MYVWESGTCLPKVTLTEHWRQQKVPWKRLESTWLQKLEWLVRWETQNLQGKHLENKQVGRLEWMPHQ